MSFDATGWASGGPTGGCRARPAGTRQRVTSAAWRWFTRPTFGARRGILLLFGHIEWDNFGELSNLDVVLRRRKRTSLREGRQFLRGYAWVTVCAAELMARLGGAAALEDSGAFHRVLPLRVGGVLLQASATMDGYTDQVMEQVFETLAPVLPPGEPRPDPAHPDTRFVPRDAATVR